MPAVPILLLIMPFSKIEIEGHSGCSITVVEQGRELLVKKSTSKPGYVNRLKMQAEKQKLFFASGFKKVLTPEIFSIEEHSGICSVTMKYIHAHNFVEFFDHAGFEKIEQFSHQIIQFLEWEISTSRMQKVSFNVLEDKFADVKKNIQISFKNDPNIKSLVSKSEKVFTQTKDIFIPVGQCHGDLTLSNVLFNHDRLFLIDFLDSFIESPIIDVVKLRQDTSFAWSYLLYGSTYDQVRHQITLDWIDQVLETHFSKYEWYNQYYCTFQLMNFLRILQYANKPDIITYLTQKINYMLDNHEF